jgi:hypothetical protein
MRSLDTPWAASNTSFARTTSRYGDVYRRARGEPWQPQALDGVHHERVILLDEWLQGRLGELLEPVADAPLRRQAGEAAEARDQGILSEIAQVLQAASPDVEERQEQ